MSKTQSLPLHDYHAHRIALIKPSALGDIIHALPILTAVRKRFPQSHITWIVNRSYEPLLRGHPDLDATLPFDRGAGRKGWINAARYYAEFVKVCRGQNFDLVLDLQGLLRSGLMAWATGAPCRVGLNTAREGATWFYTDIVPCADFNAVHAVDRYWLVAEALGAGEGPKQFRLPPPQKDELGWVLRLLHDRPRPWMALAVGSRWLTKRWPPEHFASLVRRAQESFGGTAIFVGAPDEADLARATASALRGPSVDVTGKTSLPQLAALLGQADVMLANDTGPLHLATALGRPIVAPYTCTRVHLNGPYGAEAGAVETTVACRGSYIRNCSRLDCMSELTPGRLWPALYGILQQWQTNPRIA